MFSLYLPLVAWSAEYSYAPVAGTLSSSFGWRVDPMTGGNRFHGGVDIAAPYGSSVYAPQGGKVLYTGYYGGYGNLVVVQHTPQLYSLYGHTSYILVKPGQVIRPGQVIALVGSTGRSTGPHLHFEVRQGNQYVNPLEYLSYLTQGLGKQKSLEVLLPGGSSHQVTAQHSEKALAPKKSHSLGWNVEVIKGTDVETVQF